MPSIELLTPRLKRAAYLIGAVYFLVAAAWILLSDRLVSAISISPDWLLAAQNYKGLTFVAVTTFLLVAMIRAASRRLIEALAKAESSDLQVQDLFMRHPNPMWVFDRSDFRFLRVNDAAVAQYGYTRDEFLAMTIEDIRPPEDLPALRAQLATSPAGTAHEAGVFRHLHKRGEAVHVRISAHPVELNGRACTMVMSQDVTEEISSKLALERSAARMRQLLGSLAEVLWLATPDGKRILFVNRAFDDLYGRAPDQLLAERDLWLAYVHPDDRERAAASMAVVSAQGAAVSEYRIVRPDGSTRWVQDRKQLIRDEEGRVVMIGGIAEDITARRENEAASEALQARLEDLVGQRTYALEQANIELEAFSRTAAHDLKSPLNGIVGMSYLLRTSHADRLDERGLQMAMQIERAARDMAQLVNDLMTLSRVGSVEVRKTWVDLVPLARGIVDDLRRQEPFRNVEVEFPPRLTAYCDAGLMRSLFLNLLGNAWKFTGGQDPARIGIRATGTDGGVEIAIVDNGSGFDGAEASRLFRPFERLHTQAEFQGHGLGLVTCQRIVRRHGGDIRLESSPGEGATACFTLPGALPT
jgi:PAS domain S-box-containing protein